MDPESKIVFYKLRQATFPDEDGLFAVVRWDTDESLKIEKGGISLIRRLTEGKSIGIAANESDVNINSAFSFLNKLLESGFIKSINGRPVEEASRKIKPWLSGTSRKWFSWILSKFIVYPLLIFIISGLFLGIFKFSSHLSYKSFFWHPDIFIVFISLFVAGLILMVIHEFAHFFATKAIGGEAVMRFDHRAFYIVAETESYHLAVVPRELRYVVYVAGITIDLVTIACIYWFCYVSALLGISLGIVYGYLHAIVLLQIISIIWEFNLFLETDVYLFISDMLKMDNLRNDSLKYMYSHLKKIKLRFLRACIEMLFKLFSKYSNYSSIDDLRFFNKQDKRKLFYYCLLMVLGFVFIVLQFVFLSLPRELIFIVGSIKGIFEAFQYADWMLLLKQAALLFLLTYQYLLLVYIRINKRRVHHN